MDIGCAVNRRETRSKTFQYLNYISIKQVKTDIAIIVELVSEFPIA
jgi:hypothetical protein